MNQTARPVKTFRVGSVAASIWVNEVEREGRTVMRYSVRLDKRFRDRNGAWQTSRSLFPNDIPRARLALAAAYAHISLTESEDTDNNNA